MRRLQPQIILPLIALLLASMACTMSTDPTPTAETLAVPTTTFNAGNTAEDDTADEQDEADSDTEDDDATDTTSNNNTTGSTGASSGTTDYTFSNTNPQQAVLPSCAPRTDWTNTYTVVRGDTLASIARRVNTNFRDLATGNCLADANAIEVGQVLRVPDAVAPNPNASINLGIRNDYLINPDATIDVRGTASGLPRVATIGVQLLDAQGRIVAQRDVQTQGTDIGSGGAGDFYANLYVGSDVSAYPNASADRAPFTLNVFGYENGAVKTSISRNITVIERRSDNGNTFIELDGVEINAQARVISANGRGGGLYEGNVVVEVFNSNGRVILRQPTTLNTNQVGGSGTWSITIGGDSTTTNGNGTLRVSSSSGRDGGIVVSDSQSVTFDFRADQDDFPTPFVEIESISVNTQNQTISASGNGGALFEGNVVITIWDSASMTILEQPTTLNAPDIGKSGTWSITIDASGLTTNGEGTLYARSTSPSDGSIVASDNDDLSFDFSNPNGLFEIRWSEWDRMITPNVNGQFPVSGFAEGLGGQRVRVYLTNAGGQTVAERTVTVSSSGNWNIGDFQVNAGTVGNYQLVAEQVDGDQRAAQRVIITENPANATGRFDVGSYTLVYPQGWVSISDAGFAGLATHPANDFPPGAAQGPYTLMFGGMVQQYGDGLTLRDVAENPVPAGSVSDIRYTDTTLNDGTTAILVQYTGGTGKRLYNLVFDTGSEYIVMSGQGREDVIVPLMKRTTIN